MTTREAIGQNPYEIIIPANIRDIVGMPEPNTKLSDHIHALISRGVLDERGLPTYIRALEVENLQLANITKNEELKGKFILDARIYHDYLCRPRDQSELCIREANAFIGLESRAWAMMGALVQTRDWKTEALTAHNAAQNWGKIADKVYPSLPLPVPSVK